MLHVLLIKTFAETFCDNDDFTSIFKSELSFAADISRTCGNLIRSRQCRLLLCTTSYYWHQTSQSETGTGVYNQPLNQQFLVFFSVFDSKIFQRVRFWIEVSWTCQIMILVFFNVSDLELIFFENVNFFIETFKPVEFWFKNFSTCHTMMKKKHSQNYVVVHLNPWKQQILHFPCLFK